MPSCPPGLWSMLGLLTGSLVLTGCQSRPTDTDTHQSTTAYTHTTVTTRPASKSGASSANSANDASRARNKDRNRNRTEARTESGTASRPLADSKSELRTDSRSSARADSKTESRTDPKPDPKSDSKTEGRAKTETPTSPVSESIATAPVARSPRPSQVISQHLLQEGEQLRQKGQLQEATDRFERAQRLNSKNPQSYARLSEIALRQQRPAEAERQARMGLLLAQTEAQKQGFAKLIRLAQAAQKTAPHR